MKKRVMGLGCLLLMSLLFLQACGAKPSPPDEALTPKDAVAVLKNEALDARIRGEATLLPHVLALLKKKISPVPGYEVLDHWRDDYKIFASGEADHARQDGRLYLASLAPSLYEGRQVEPLPMALSHRPRMWRRGRTGIESPAGICRMDETIVVSDQASHDLVLLDAFGRRLQRIGGTGTGEDDFLQPRALCYDALKEEIYVVDSGNKRLKVLGKDFKTKRSHPLPESFEASSVAVNAAGQVYLASVFTTYPQHGLYALNDDGSWQGMGYLIGSLVCHAGEVYAAQVFETMGVHVDEDVILHSEMGGMYSYLYRLSGKEAYVVDAFAPLFSPLALLSTETGFYAWSAHSGKIFSLDWQGEQLQMLGERSPQLPYRVNPMTAYAMAGEAGTIYLCHPTQQAIYVLDFDEKALAQDYRDVLKMEP